MPDISRPTLPHLAIERPEEPVNASLAHVRYELLQNGNIRASLVMENLWFTAFFRNSEGMDDEEGERLVSVEDKTLDIGSFLKYIESGIEESELEQDLDGPTGTRVLRPATAQRLLAHFNAMGCNFQIRQDNDWYCHFCCAPVRVRQKDDITQHINTKKHKDSVANQTGRIEKYSNIEVGVDIGQELTEMMIAVNIPLFKTTQKPYRSFIEGFSGLPIPSERTCRRRHVPYAFDKGTKLLSVLCL